MATIAQRDEKISESPGSVPCLRPPRVRRSTMSSNLIGGIVERTRPTVVPSAPSPSSVHYAARGFPVAKHRSQSAFARARQNKSEAAVERPTSVPVVQSTGTRLPPGSSSLNALAADGDAQDWRAQMSHQNAASVESMTDEERQRAISEIFDTLGDGVGDLLQRARAARARQRAGKRSRRLPTDRGLTQYSATVPGRAFIC